MATHLSALDGQRSSRNRARQRPRVDRRSSSQSDRTALLAEILSAMTAIVGPAAADIDVVDAAKLGKRVKVAVTSGCSGLDPVAHCAGPGGARAREFTTRLGAFIEFVKFDPDPERYIAAALNVPVRAVRIDAATCPPTAVAIVDPDIYPVAVGKSGANARCASSLTGHVVTICTPNCSSTTHRHPVGLSSSDAAPLERRGTPSHQRAATRAPQPALVFPPLPPHVRSERATRRRRIQEAKRQ
jgi:transcription antitermination factor NusA-like protein